MAKDAVEIHAAVTQSTSSTPIPLWRRGYFRFAVIAFLASGAAAYLDKLIG